MAAVAEALGAAGAEASGVERFVHGMTVGTNALLEGRVARTALLATEGFTDLEELGRQARPELYRLCAGHPPPIVPAELRVAVPERTGPDGVLRELDEDALRETLAGLDCEAAAVCLLWGFRHPGHERRVAELAEAALGGDPRLDLARDGGGVPRVRALRDDDRRRRPVAPAARLPRAPHRARRRRRPARAGDHAVERRHRRRRDGGPARILDGAVGPGRRRGRRGARGRAPTRSGSTWAGRPATCRCCSAAAPRSGAGAASADARWRCRWWTCTRSGPAAARSPGATRAARCAWGRARPVPIPARPATGAAAPSRP